MRACTIFSAVVLTLGCTQQFQVAGTVKLAGKVTKDGEPLQVEGREMGLGMVQIGFCRIDDEQDPVRIRTTTAMVDEDGNFEVVDGLEPGRYVVTVEQWDPYPTTDRLKGKFNDRNSTIIREISADTELVLDLSNPAE